MTSMSEDIKAINAHTYEGTLVGRSIEDGTYENICEVSGKPKDIAYTINEWRAEYNDLTIEWMIMDDCITVYTDFKGFMAPRIMQQYMAKIMQHYVAPNLRK